jgi:hypothetical protein
MEGSDDERFGAEVEAHHFSVRQRKPHRGPHSGPTAPKGIIVLGIDEDRFLAATGNTAHSLEIRQGEKFRTLSDFAKTLGLQIGNVSAAFSKVRGLPVEQRTVEFRGITAILEEDWLELSGQDASVD